MSEANNNPVFTTSSIKLLTAGEVAEILSVSKSFAYQLMRTGEIPTVRLGRSVRVRPKDLDRYIDAQVEAD